ncbi:piggyBac transposable element-derived protein 4-like [Montipora foliosa]|uniref:piggyBac transposable element-derived protein 4-like n=1 Tax=Montipora foliosa TaxID=591990 RepID=UPI0035F1D796
MAEPLIVSAEEFHDIFGSSDEENNAADFNGSDIDVQELDSDIEEDENESESDNDSNASDTIEWSDELEDFDIEEFSGQQAIKFNVPENVSPNDFFSQLFGDSVIDTIVTETNRYARQKLADTPRLQKWKDITNRELKAYFGICIIMGINNLPRIAMYWSTDPFIGNSGIQSVMTKNRFEEVSQYLHFVDSSKEPARGDANYDKLFKIRPILSIVLDNIQNAYEPSKNLSVDEAMIAFKGRLSFRQYMPAKPTKYGIKVWMAADSQNGYVCNYAVYLSQEGQARLHGLGYDVVMKMATPFLNKYRHIFFDNFFTSTNLMEHLLAQNTYACGTVRCNRKDLPPCSKNKLKQGERVSAQRNQLVFTKWHDKRDISFLSTNVLPSEPARVVQRRRNGRDLDIEKPRVADVYTSYMGGVDRADQLRSFYFTGYSSRKWYRYIFWFLFNLAVCNAFVLESFHRTTRGQTKRAMINFRLDLAKQLISDFSQQQRKRRSQEPQQHSVAREAHVSVHVEGRKRKCVQCSKAGRRTPKGYKVETRFECSLCKVALCRTPCHNLYHDQTE